MGAWREVRIMDVVEPLTTVDPKKQPDETFEYIDVSSVSRDTSSVQKTTTVLGRDAPSRARRLVHAGDVLFATIRPTLQRITVVPDHLDGSVCSTGYFVLRPKREVHSRFLFHYLFGQAFFEEMASLQRGASYPAVSDRDVKEHAMRLPPLPEQKRIVAILDEAFAAIATATANAEKNLANARELFESGLSLAFQKKGDGWIEKELGDVCEIGDGNYSSKYPKAHEFLAEGVPFLTATNIKGGTIHSDKMRFISRSQHSLLAKGHISEGDLVVVVRGSSTGKCSIVPKKYDGSNMNSQLAFLRACSEVNHTFLFYAFNSTMLQGQVRAAISGAAQPQLPNKHLLQLTISYPQLSEQEAIVRRLGQLSGEAQALGTLYEQKAPVLSELRQSILHKAFTGELTADAKAANRLLSEAGL